MKDIYIFSKEIGPQQWVAATAVAPVQSGSASVAPAAKPARDTSGIPYLWDVLRSSTSKDPRNP